MTITVAGRRADPQRPAAAAVVIPSILRPSLLRAVRSVYAQTLPGQIHILIGVDVACGDLAILEQATSELPDHCVLTVLQPGYSTSTRHGGLHPAHDGGALRTVLSYLANSRHVAYLDDDNWWAEEHLESLLAAVKGKDWAFSLRWYVDGETLEPLCVDRWESVGPDRGAYAENAGGFVDPNCLLLDKLRCEPVLRWWSIPLAPDPERMSADRNVFSALRARHSYGSTGKATAYYVLDPKDPVHPYRKRWIAETSGGPE